MSKREPPKSNEYVEATKEELEAVGIVPTVEFGGKHILIRWEHDGAPRRHTVPCTGSDRRGVQNSRSEVRRMLREDGLIGEAEPEATAVAAVFPRNGALWCSSLDIAARFGKAHKDVLRAIDRIAEEIGQEFTERNFCLSSYTDPTGRALRAFDLSRDAFSLVAMGFTGSKALEWKRQYLDAFNAMEREIQAIAQSGMPGRVAYLEGEVKALADLLTDGVEPAPRREKRQVILPSTMRARRAARRERMAVAS